MAESFCISSRRQFLTSTIAAFAGQSIIPASAMGRDGHVAPSERISLGVVGLGSRGFNLLHEFLDHADARITALCDVDSLHYRDRPWQQGPAMGLEPAAQTVQRKYANATSGTPAAGLRTTTDFREICGREDIDAVVVATPDHWHALCSLTALRQGKDVYCEKPVTHTFREGRAVYREVARREAVFQTGSQQRSEDEFHRAVNLVRNGHIGTLRNIEVGLPPGYDTPQGDTDIVDVPDHLNYDLWCGPSAMLPYLRARHHRWWRGHRTYGGGTLMDWIGHHNDIAHWAMGMDHAGPLTVEAVDWTKPQTEIYNTPHHYTIRCTYPGGIETSISSQHPIGSKYIGDNGWVFVSRGKLTASDARLVKRSFDPGDERVAVSPGHTRNFLDSIRSRQPCIAPAETAHRSITPGHLGYVSHALGRRLNWDATREIFTDDPEATALLMQHDYRPPWRIDEEDAK